MSEGPFTDDMVRKFVMTAQTHEGIRKYAEAMAYVLAQAAIASNEAGQGSPTYALDRWTQVIKERAAQIIKEKTGKGLRELPAPTIDALAEMEKLLK